MRIAVIGDIHGNIHALVSVLEDITCRNVDCILSTGDLVGYLPFPNEVIHLIRENRILSVQGNHDCTIAMGKPLSKDDVLKLNARDLIAGASAVFTNRVVTEDNRQYLRFLPENLRMTVGEYKLLLIHGSPRRIDEYMHDDLDLLESIVGGVQDDVIISGHTHVPYHRIIQGKHIINAGSVGKPKHGNANATYIVIDIKGLELEVEIYEVPYDVEKTATVVEQSNFFDPKLAGMLRQGY